MSERRIEVDSAGVYVGMSLQDFGVRVSGKGDPTVPREKLRESIEHLQEELSEDHPLSKEDRAQLERVLAEVSGILDATDDEASEEGKSLDELPNLVERFESTHPQLAALLGRIADSLSQLGI